MISALLARLRGTVPAPKGSSAHVSSTLSDALAGTCPRCQKILAGHRCQQFAITVASKERTKEFLEFIETAKGHEWSQLSAFQEFDGTKNALVVFALECPNGNLSMLLVRDPFELLDSKSIEHWESLPVDAAQGWTTFLRKAKWEVFGKESKNKRESR